ncbi:hypothetical protein QBZ16_003635 [Prototheca wickerhamii]|uniref:Uncharacterized protein n=1 Tax=Prototheca wickerhamii TaxID=3111 RepID=A0AAD9MKW6_PROWI|nr:hypothetical protein QBZ16_003635 [Prototheca wickerhamii]
MFNWFVSYAEEAVVAEAKEKVLDLADKAVETVKSAVSSEEPEAEEPAPEVEEEAEPEPETKEIVLQTAPVDFRFPIQNQSRHCYVAYCEAHRCFQTKGEDSTDCQRLAKVYRSICPVEWLTQWNEARENGTWWGKY